MRSSAWRWAKHFGGLKRELEEKEGAALGLEGATERLTGHTAYSGAAFKHEVANYATIGVVTGAQKETCETAATNAYNAFVRHQCGSLQQWTNVGKQSSSQESIDKGTESVDYQDQDEDGSLNT